ncbi:hypothetical protein ACFLUH_03765 [Chloroflexota bacterium]
MERGLNQRVYQKLKQVARDKGLVTYSEIAPLIDTGIRSPRDPRLGKILREICSYEVQHGRPMLGSVVVHKVDRQPGKGYFKGANILGLFSGGDKFAFWESELDRVYHYWSSH